MRDAGECSEGIKPTVELLRGKGIGAIIACAAEADICITVWTPPPPPPFPSFSLKNKSAPTCCPSASRCTGSIAHRHKGGLRRTQAAETAWTNMD